MTDFGTIKFYAMLQGMRCVGWNIFFSIRPTFSWEDEFAYLCEFSEPGHTQRGWCQYSRQRHGKYTSFRAVARRLSLSPVPSLNDASLAVYVPQYAVPFLASSPFLCGTISPDWRSSATLPYTHFTLHWILQKYPTTNVFLCSKNEAPDEQKKSSWENQG